jgi:hypothetical protein
MVIIAILVLRHQITVPERRLGPAAPGFRPEDLAIRAALLTSCPAQRCVGSGCLSHPTWCCAGIAR